MSPNKKNTKKDTTLIFPSRPIWLLRSMIGILLAISLGLGIYHLFASAFTIEDMQNIATTSINTIFVLIAFVLSLNFLKPNAEKDKTYISNVKKYIFNLLIPVSTSILCYSLSFIENLSLFIINCSSSITLITLVYGTTRSLVFMISCFKIDTLDN